MLAFVWQEWVSEWVSNRQQHTECTSFSWRLLWKRLSFHSTQRHRRPRVFVSFAVGIYHVYRMHCCWCDDDSFISHKNRVATVYPELYCVAQRVYGDRITNNSQTQCRSSAHLIRLDASHRKDVTQRLTTPIFAPRHSTLSTPHIQFSFVFIGSLSDCETAVYLLEWHAFEFGRRPLHLVRWFWCRRR